MIAAHLYKNVRIMCHNIKNGKANISVINFVAGELRRLINDQQAVLIPIPSHIGYATYTRKIAEATSLRVVDCILCNPRKPLYELKKKGISVKPEELQFFLDTNARFLPENFDHVYLIDLVYATGTTAKAAQDLFKFKPTVAAFAFYERVNTEPKKLVLSPGVFALN